MNPTLILLLHAHLPFVKHPEHEYSLEENWLFEAIRETYIPLLHLIESLVNKSISPQLSMTVSPTLTEMLDDEMLRSRFIRYIDNLIKLSEAEKIRTANTEFGPVSALYHSRFKQVKHLYVKRYRQDLVSAFRRLQDEGHIEIVATCATHAFLPAFEQFPDLINKQISVGIESYTRCFGKKPSGFWLPECGYFKGLDLFLKKAGIKFFFLESHGILNSNPSPGHGVYLPVQLPSGLMAFGRDITSSSQVWCATRGYPGDSSYRDFYRDIGFDLPLEYTGKYTHFDGIRTFTGMKYHKVTGRTDDKLPYNRKQAVRKVSEHASHFKKSRAEDFARLSDHVSCPVIFAAFDAELFGHWWFEGPEWLEAVIRKIFMKDSKFRVSTPSAYLAEYIHDCSAEDIAVVEPSPSSWGEGGYNALWIGEKNHYIYRHLHKMAGMMDTMIKRKKKKNAKRILSQALREMLLAQSSDWAFLIQKGNASEYAGNRFKTHLDRFNSLYSMLMENEVDDNLLSEMEKSDSLFRWL